MKRDLLTDLQTGGGPGAILAIGQNLDHAVHDPIWVAALQSADPWVLLDKWQRFERFAHWNNRTAFEPLGDTRLRVRRFSINGTQPTGSENLLVCGLLVGLLGRIGCTGLSCDMGEDAQLRIVENAQIADHLDLPDSDTNQWEIRWQSCPPRPPPILKSNQVTLFAENNGLSGPMIDAVNLMQQDPSRAWTVGALATATHMSQRTFQRRLRESGLSFSKIVRLIRVHEACNLLDKTDLPITAIAFCSGFSDSAHFSRDFSASTGLSPRAYRNLGLACK